MSRRGRAGTQEVLAAPKYPTTQYVSYRAQAAVVKWHTIDWNNLYPESFRWRPRNHQTVGILQNVDPLLDLRAGEFRSQWWQKKTKNKKKTLICICLVKCGNGNPLQCSCLENPRDGGAWWAAVYGVTQSRTRLRRLSSSSTVKCRGNSVIPRSRFTPKR